MKPSLIVELINQLSEQDIRKRLQHVSLKDLSIVLSCEPPQVALKVQRAFSKVFAQKIIDVFNYNIDQYTKQPPSDLEMLRCTQAVVKALSGKEFIDWNVDKKN